MLPFEGEAAYDAELEAWVGHHQISKYFPGDIVRCDIPSPGAEGTTPTAQPNWKQVIASPPSTGRQANSHDAVLVSMCSGRFCLVESVTRDGLRRPWGSGDRFELRLTTLRARYGKNGELTTIDRRLVRSYVHSRYAGYHFNVNAFWM
ncbi:hypothetical protein BAE44_0010090 [Dichanthelium oligosanthes]|uniref:Uncharacterized protein n=1 Tax=Dichanthelium oligosanthes TaxID=888268 RepID=A0A1E5VUX0_9POAL|nr:hypothetical protein BAE44_0010090 [Dichanthelium oligosanthes]